jgi:hypothetical protein
MRCPVCRADVDAGPQCRRCRADLSLLFTLEDQRRQSLRAAYEACAAGQPERMLVHAVRADELRRDEESGGLVALARLLRRDFAGAWHVYRTRFRWS